MEKNQLIESVKEAARQGIISENEIVKAVRDVKNEQKSAIYSWDISKTLYFIGATVIFIGIVIFAGQKWNELNSVSKILITLGSAIACYVTGVILSHYKKIELIGQSFYLISMLLMPVGLHIIFDIAGFDIGSCGMQSLISAILLIYYVLSFLIFRKDIFIIFNIIFGTWFFFAFSSYLLKANPYMVGSTFTNYRILAVGLTYMLLGYFFSERNKIIYSRLLYSFGVVAVLSAAFALGGYEPNQSLFWEIIYPGIIFGLIFLGIYLKTKVFLTFSSAFFFAYICKITFEYFKDSIGWPLSLIILGLALIGTGYLTIYLHKRFNSSISD